MPKRKKCEKDVDPSKEVTENSEEDWIVVPPLDFLQIPNDDEITCHLYNHKHSRIINVEMVCGLGADRQYLATLECDKVNKYWFEKKDFINKETKEGETIADENVKL